MEPQSSLLCSKEIANDFRSKPDESIISYPTYNIWNHSSKSAIWESLGVNAGHIEYGASGVDPSAMFVAKETQRNKFGNHRGSTNRLIVTAVVFFLFEGNDPGVRLQIQIASYLDYNRFRPRTEVH
jgi:hypothetical protein